MVKNLPADSGDAADPGLIPGWGRSPGGGNGNPLWHSCLENPMDRAWRAIVRGVTESDMSSTTRNAAAFCSRAKRLWITNMSPQVLKKGPLRGTHKAASVNMKILV